MRNHLNPVSPSSPPQTAHPLTHKARTALTACLILSLATGTRPTFANPAPNSTTPIAQSTCAANLSQQIDQAIDRPEYQRSQWGILAQTIGSRPQTLYARNAERFLVPASNVKLLTTAAALTQLGADFRIRTSVYLERTTPEGAVLRVVGRGDPSLTNEQLQVLAQQIRDRGITRIASLIGDDRYFRGDAVNPSWEWEDIQAGYGAPINSLILNQNAIGLTLVPQQTGEPLGVTWDQPSEAQGWQIVNRSQTVAADAPEFVSVGRDLGQPILTVAGQLRVGSASEPVAVSIPQPGQNFLQQFAETLRTAGVPVDRTQLITDGNLTDGNPDRGSQFATPAEIAAVDSPPLGELLIETNRFSNNLHAEALLRSLGINFRENSRENSEANRVDESESALAAGIRVLKETLARLGVNPDGYELADGSGLSRRNWVSPAAIVETLQAMTRTTNALPYRTSLSVAGISGTLQNRFRDTTVQGQLQGKTGALTGTAALSGYLNRGDRPPIAFSIIVNQANTPPGEIRQTIDGIVMLLQGESCR
ncbi:D-alanyl-D-alanine carboxypeptidase/D-alanyl-D-alanine endopeptidase [Leptolyngbya ohadii]|uniref:D-alanyl-D-alanine carboxypeptidase/D-alanyl-D-alanine endopeptidase n=1 Tax=Leptolyngbya ohadii TaxID=1962290 RepID=UPI000B5A0F4C|nr:D-alanyl-D-alanine carboxypeptidase/D-alanyl-D-alanine-endopeptidase [Leptolyngbya ohadii]